jgi:hypothetical protein
MDEFHLHLVWARLKFGPLIQFWPFINKMQSDLVLNKFLLWQPNCDTNNLLWVSSLLQALSWFEQLLFQEHNFFELNLLWIQHIDFVGLILCDYDLYNVSITTRIPGFSNRVFTLKSTPNDNNKKNLVVFKDKLILMSSTIGMILFTNPRLVLLIRFLDQ